MWERLATGWELAKQSFRVLRLDKELLFFPLFSGLSCMLVMATFAVPLFVSGAFESLSRNEESTSAQIFAAVIGFAYYFVNYFVIIFFNSALVGCAVIRLKGGDPTVSDGFATSFSRLPQILGWAALAATVGIILKTLESRSNKLGQFLISLLGMAWSIMTFFVVPILVIEKLGPFAAVKRSMQLMKSTWGESLAANFSLGLINFIAVLVAIVPIVAGAFLFASSTVLAFSLIAIGVVVMLAVSLVTSTLQSIILAALYLYAVEGKSSEHFDAGLIDHAFASGQK